MTERVLFMYKASPADLESAGWLYDINNPEARVEALDKIERGLAFVIREKKGRLVTVIPLPDIPDIDAVTGHLSMTPPAIHPDYFFTGIACFVVPVGPSYAALYLHNVASVGIPHNDGIAKALTNLGFVETRQGYWSLRMKEIQHSAHEIARVCSSAIFQCEGSAGKVAVVKVQPGALLRSSNRTALMNIAEEAEKVDADGESEGKANHLLFGKNGQCAD